MSLQTTKEATNRTLFKHMFDQMQKLNSKVISVEEAKAQANLCKQANNLLKYELDRAKAIEKYENIQIREIEDQKD